ncbi:hypothetical protein B4U80_01945 [Leptotrombidium deliense]|uniref:Sel1 repeat family protein n=1 Tax=Leptotrombidium deliense TaxID=299467 RepID=A0A443SHE4_9ACAR|nr:hypothetical protein B4U80_01945 [Leptotrombidium deliense]
MVLRRRRGSSVSSEEALLPNAENENVDRNRKVRFLFAKRKKPDGPIMIAFQISVVVVAVALSLYTYFYFEPFHRYVTHVYAHTFDDKHAQHALGHKLLINDKNETGAFHWFRRSADNGHPHSAYNLAAGHLSGYNTDVKKGEVKQLLQYAAKHGIAEAQHLLDNLCKEKPAHCEH